MIQGDGMRVRLILAILVTFLVSCGGGGGGGSNPAPTPPPAPPTTPTSNPDDALTINDNNAVETVTFASSYAEALIQLSIVAIEGVNTTDFNNYPFESTNSCRNSDGTMTVRLYDNNNDGKLNAEDQLTISFGNCDSRALQDKVNGDLELLVSNFIRLKTGDFILSADISFPDKFTIFQSLASIDLKGSFSLSYQSYPERDKLGISMKQNDKLELVIEVQNGTIVTEKISEVALARQYTAETTSYDINFSGKIRSEALKGTFTCATAQLLGVENETNPRQGELECKGANPTASRIIPSTNNASRVEVDNGNGFTTVADGISWNSFTEGTLLGGRLFGLLGRTSLEHFKNIPIESKIDLKVSTMIYNNVQGFLYIGNDDGIHELNVEDLSVNRSFQTPTPISCLEQSSESGKLLACSKTNSSFYVFNIDNFTIENTIAIQDSDSGKSLFAKSIKAIRNKPNNYIVAAQTSSFTEGKVSVYSSGSEQQSYVSYDFGTPSALAISETDRIFGFDSGTTIKYVMEFTLTNQGIVEKNRIPDFFGEESDTVEAIDGDLITADTRFNLDSKLIEGVYRPTGGSYGKAFTIDKTASLMYRASDRLTTFDLNSYRVLSSYTLDLNSSARHITVASDRIFIADDASIVSISRNKIVNYDTIECERSPLESVIPEANYRKFNCIFSDMVIDNERRKIYASVPSQAGSKGNSIAIINLDNYEFEQFVYIGSEPSYLSLSAGATKLYVGLQGRNSIAELNLSNMTVTYQNLPTLFGTNAYQRPSYVTDISSSPFNANTLLFKTDREKYRLLQEGNIAPNNMDNELDLYPKLRFNPDDPSKAYGVESSKLIEVDVDTLGISESARYDYSYIGGDLYVSDSKVFLAGGTVYDLNTHTFSQKYVITAGGEKISSNKALNRLYIITSSGPLELNTFEYGSGNKLNTAPIPYSGGGTINLIDMNSELNTDIAILSRYTLTLLPHPSLD